MASPVRLFNIRGLPKALQDRLRQLEEWQEEASAENRNNGPIKSLEWEDFSPPGFKNLPRELQRGEAAAIVAASVSPKAINYNALATERGRAAATRKLTKGLGILRDRNGAGRLLCDSLFTQKVARENPELVGVTRTMVQRGEGTFGSVSSAEIRVRTAAGKESSCVAVMKVGKPQGADYSEEGFDMTIPVELSTYSRVRNFKHAAKCMFIKLRHAEIKYLMENYVADVKKFYELFPFPAAPAAGASPAEMATHATKLAAVHTARARIAKSVVFQVAHGLKEFHDNNLLHKDLKPPNILVRHDGRVMLTDYGLCIYNPAGVKTPTQTYYQPTTLWYEPPEANAAGVEAGVEAGISHTYDIWSLGVSMFEIMTDDFVGVVFGAIFPRNKRADATLDLYRHEAGRALYMLGPTAPGAPSYKRGSDAQAHDLLSHMLDLNPRTRYSADDILAHPWFTGYTMREATQVMRNPMGAANTNVPQTRKANVLAGARRRGEAGAMNNAGVAEYISLLSPIPKGAYRDWASKQESGPVATQVNQKMFRILSNWEAEVIVSNNMKAPWAVYLHSLELLDRFISARVIPHSDLQKYGTVAMMLAGKVYAHQGRMLRTDGTVGIGGAFNAYQTGDLRYVTANAFTKAQISTAELDMIEALNGDLYPVKDGIVEHMHGSLIGEVIRKPRTQRVMLATLFYIVWDGKRGDAKKVVELAKRVQRHLADGTEGEIPRDEMGILDSIKATRFFTVGEGDSLSNFRKWIFHTDIFPARDLFPAFGLALADMPPTPRQLGSPFVERTIQLLQPARP